MIMTTVVAVALGFAPVANNGTVQQAPDNYAMQVGRFIQSVDALGRTHLRGFNRFTGAPYELTLDQAGHVEGSVGDDYVTFEVHEIA